MEMNLQNIYFIVGVVGFVFAAICAIAAAVYFFRADIRGVLAELSGKTRAAELAEFNIAKRGRSSKKSALASGDEWTGVVSRGDLSARSGSDAITDDSSTPSAGSGVSSDWSYSDSVDALGNTASDNAETVVGNVSSAPQFQPQPHPQGFQPMPQSVPVGAQAHAAQGSFVTGSFAITRQIVAVHSASVVDEYGNEVAIDSAGGGAR